MRRDLLPTELHESSLGPPRKGATIFTRHNYR